MAAMELVNLHLFPCANCSKHPMIRHVLKWKDGPLQGGTGSPWNQNSQVDMFGVLLGHKYDDCNKKNYWIEANQLPKTSKWYYLTHVSNFQLEKKNRRKTPNTIFNFHLVSSLSLIKRRKDHWYTPFPPNKTFAHCLNQCSCVCIHLHSIVQMTKNDHYYLPESEYTIHDTPKNKSKIESGDTRSKLSFLGYVEIPSTHQKDTEQNGAKQLHHNMIIFRFHVTLGEWSVSCVFFFTNFVPRKFSPWEQLKQSQAGYRKWQERRFASDFSGSMLKFRGVKEVKESLLPRANVSVPSF